MAALDFKALMREERLKLKTGAQQKTLSVLESENKIDKTLVFEPLFTFPPRKPDILQIGDIPTLSYVSNYVSIKESNDISRFIHSVPFSHSKWVSLKGRQLQCWDGTTEELPHWLQTLCDGLVTSGLFPFNERPNHILINRYGCSDGTIMPHTDGPLYIPRTVTMSLSPPTASSSFQDSIIEQREQENESQSIENNGTELGRKRMGALMRFRLRQKTSEIGIEPEPCIACQVALCPGSLVKFEDDLYTNYLHSIPIASPFKTDDAVDEVGDVVGDDAECVNGDVEDLEGGCWLHRPEVRLSLTFRHKKM